MQSCARICVEVDLEKGLLEAIQLTLDNWSYIQKVDYESFPFQCKTWHEYGNFAKNFPLNKLDQQEERAQEQWQQPKRKKATRKEVQQQDPTQGGNPPPSSPQNPRYLARGYWGRESRRNQYEVLENLEEYMGESKEKGKEIEE